MKGQNATAAHEAYRKGDLEALRRILGDPPDFPNCVQPWALGLSDYPLEYAIYWSPFPFIATLVALGADPNYPDQDGFPSLIAALSSERPDREAVMLLLLEKGADVAQRGLNDWTPLHMAVSQKDLKAIALLLAHGADPLSETRIDDCSTPLQDAEAAGWEAGIALLQQGEREID